MILSLKKNYALLLALLLAAGLIFSALSYKKAHADLGIPFGGDVEDVNYCCNGIEIDVGDPNGGDFIIPWTTFADGFYSDYNVFVPDGQDVLGNEEPGDVCANPDSKCATTPLDGTVTMIGSSL